MKPPCGGCMKARRAIISRTPKPLRERLTRAFLPPESPIPIVTTAEAVVRETRTWVGVPFHHHGRTRTGIDCWGLPIVVLQNLGVELPEGFVATDYPRQPLDAEGDRRIAQYCTTLPQELPGCLVALRLQRTITHVAILTDTDTLIHVLERHKVVIEHGFRGMWRTKFAPSYWALPGVRYG